MRRPSVKVISLLLLSLAVCVSLFFQESALNGTVTAEGTSASNRNTHSTALDTPYEKGGYDEYLSKYDPIQLAANDTIVIEGESYSEVKGMEVSIVENRAGNEGQAVLTEDSGAISWAFEVKQEGLYNLGIHFYSEPGKDSDIERELLVDGQSPFNEARSITFNRIWKNEKQSFDRDARGNDLLPNQIEEYMWQESLIKDNTGFYEEPFLFYFSRGQHTLTLTSVKEPLLIDWLKLSAPEIAPTYAEVASKYKEDGLKQAADVSIKLQAEQALYKSTPSLLPYNDRSSPAVEPYHVSKLRNNAMGGWAWRMPGQWIEWEIEVEQEGLYQIALKNRQNYLNGMSALRSIYIDGKLPFKELKEVQFPYNHSWQMNVLGTSKDEPYLFHLTKGKHRLRMEVTLGELAPILRSVETSILELNALYRQIISYTGTVPDTFRDYNLEQRIPEMIEVFEKQSKLLYSIASSMEGPSESGNDRTAIINRLAYQLKDMAGRPESVPSRIEAFKTNVGALGSWMLTINEQPLALDYLIVSSPEAKLPKPEATRWAKMLTGIKSFAASFSENYDDFSDEEETKQSVTVWVTSARDQAQVIKRLIDDRFTSTTGIHVNLKLVSADVLLPSTVSGKGPDVALQVGNDLPMNYASRSALQDLSAFPDYPEVQQQFLASAMVPYEYKGSYYALPEQQTFPMMFFRKDILEDELHLEVPETWQDVYDMLPTLQKHNLQFGLPQKPLDSIGNELATTNIMTLPPNPAFAMFLLQQGGQFYKDGGKSSDLDSETSISEFKKWTDFYVNYKIPIAADFANRFRTGEMPIGIVDYTMYNKLTVFAPEIKGLWSFAPVPGVAAADGSFHREVGSGGSASIMFKQAKNKEEAWTFLKWWTGKDTQVAFGRQMEIRMGAAARYPTANMEALASLPWPTKDFQMLQEQMKWVKGIPEVPGGYLTGRNIDNAFRRVVVQGEDPRETMDKYVRAMNEEITLKRKEFNLPY